MWAHALLIAPVLEQVIVSLFRLTSCEILFTENQLEKMKEYFVLQISLLI